MLSRGPARSGPLAFTVRTGVSGVRRRFGGRRFCRRRFGVGVAGVGVFFLLRQRRQRAGVVFGGREEVRAADLQPQRVGRPRIRAERVGVAGLAEAAVVDEHPHPRPLHHPGDQLLDEARVVDAGDRPLGDPDRLPLPLLALVEAVEVLPDRILRVEVGARPVDPAAAGPVVAGEVALHPRRAAGQRAPDDAHRRRRQRFRIRPLGPVQPAAGRFPRGSR